MYCAKTAINGERGVAMNGNMALLRERWSDPLLTLLTGLLFVMLFVIAPLQALGVFVFQAFELVLQSSSPASLS